MKSRTNLIIILLFFIAMTFSNCSLNSLLGTNEVETTEEETASEVSSTNGLTAEYFKIMTYPILHLKKLTRKLILRILKK